MRAPPGLAVLILSGLLSSLATAADPAPPTLPPVEKPKISVTKVTEKASLGDDLVIMTLPEPSAYLAYANDQKKSVTLFLNGNDTGIVADAKGATLTFHLDRNASDSQGKRIWSALLRDPFSNPVRTVEASIGLAGGVAEPSKSTFKLVVIKCPLPWYAWLWAVVLIGVLIVFGWLVIKKDLLRDGPRPAPFSLGRCQMAWWFLLILIGYVFIWLISGDRDAITESLLVLMGISAGTGLSAVLIDSTGGTAALTQAASDQLALQVAQQNAQTKVTTASTAVATATAAGQADAVAQKQLLDGQAELAALNARLLQARNSLNNTVATPASQNLFLDILSDGQGEIGLHRFQIVVWTVVLGIIFVSSVVIELSMPTFSTPLLTLMGISAGTYLGFKFPEK